jgi:flagellar protein FliO/FliZ
VIARLARAARLPRSTAALLALAAIAVALPFAGGDLAPAAARAALCAAAIGAALVALRRRPDASARVADAPRVTVVARATLGREASVALLEVEGRRVLVGFGAGAVSLLSELPPEGGRP